jgi:hypothetical protein
MGVINSLVNSCSRCLCGHRYVESFRYVTPISLSKFVGVLTKVILIFTCSLQFSLFNEALLRIGSVEFLFLVASCELVLMFPWHQSRSTSICWAGLLQYLLIPPLLNKVLLANILAISTLLGIKLQFEKLLSNCFVIQPTTEDCFSPTLM